MRAREKLVNERRRSALYGMLFGYASILIAFARNVLFVPIYLREIPLSEYGAWLATGGALALILINDFGLSGVVTQKISASHGAGDADALGPLAGSSLAIGVIMAFVLTVISFIFVRLLPGLETLSGPQQQTIVNCFVIAIAANGLGIIGVTAISVIRSLQRMISAGAIVMAADLANVAVTLIGLFAGKGLYAIAAGMLARSAIMALAATIGVALIYSLSLRLKLVIQWPAVRALLADSSRFFVSAVAMKLQSQGTVLFVTSALGPTTAAIYSLTVRAHETVLMLIGQINSALVPSVTHLLGSGNFVRFRALLLRMLLSLGAVTALAMSVTVILNAGFLRLWIGNKDFAGQSVSILMAAALFISSLGFVAYDALVAQGKFKFVSRVFVLTSLLQIALLMLFLRNGLWIGPIVSLTVACVWGAVFWRNVSAEIGLTLAESRGLLKELTRVGAVSVVASAGFIWLFPTATTWVSLTIEGLACATVLIVGYTLSSTTIRNIVSEEIGLTLRALRQT
jgi:O-antigen/teichoic acid export membrane protein